jgi:hypothetical protein
METMHDLTPAARLLWHKPQVQYLPIARTTADFAKDGSTEDLQSKVDNWPEGAPREL